MGDELARRAAEDHYYSALDHYAEGRHEQAIADYEAAIAVDSSFVDAMHGLARVLQDAERYGRAIAVARRIAELEHIGCGERRPIRVARRAASLALSPNRRRQAQRPG